MKRVDLVDFRRFVPTLLALVLERGLEGYCQQARYVTEGARLESSGLGQKVVIYLAEDWAPQGVEKKRLEIEFFLNSTYVVRIRRKENSMTKFLITDGSGPVLALDILNDALPFRFNGRL